MADQEFLASFGVEIDETGVQRLQQALEKNRALAEELAAAFSRAREAVQAFFRELAETSMPNPEAGSVPRVTEDAQKGASVSFALDFTKANRDLQAFRKEAEKAVKLSADASAVVSAGRNALYQLQSLFASTVLPLHAQVSVAGGAASAGNGIWNAISSIASQLKAPTLFAPVTNNASRSVQAPVTINVTAAGTDPEAVGRSVYNVAEQYLLRTLRTCPNL